MFTYRDLMVNLGPRPQGGAVPAFFCDIYTCFCTYGCTETCGGSWCHFFGSRCPGVSVTVTEQLAAVTDPTAVSQQLGVLKSQLQQALLQIEQQEQALAHGSQPQTLAQVEERETKLHEELAKLDRRKKELEKKY